MSAETAQALIVTPHAAVNAVLTAVIGDFHHRADENLGTELGRGGFRGAFVQLILSCTS
jgi:hypothetical protein